MSNIQFLQFIEHFSKLTLLRERQKSFKILPIDVFFIGLFYFSDEPIVVIHFGLVVVEDS